MKDPLSILQEVWGYPSFREGQQDIVERVVAGDNLLALLPTGGGKSICFQVPALAKDGITIVISPLISLMQDQVQSLKKRKIKAEAIYTGLSFSMIDTILDNCIYGDIKLLYVSPERLQSDLFLERLKQMNVAMIAVDEAHCISQWGYDFRPSYLNVISMREILPDVQIVALTATAPPTVAKDICQNLDIPEDNILYNDFRRPNLHYIVNPAVDKDRKLYALLKATQGPAIVYCRRRNQTETIAYALQKRGISALAYHAGYDSGKRAKIQEEFMESKIRVIAATTAFGMGIDKSDVRYVYHMEPPMSPEEYFQEAGRAGRDGEDAWCVLLYNETDPLTMQERLEQAYPPIDYIERLYRSLAIFYNLAYEGGLGEQFLFDIDAFCSRFGLERIEVYNGLKFIERSGWILMTEGIHQPSRFRIIAGRKDLYNLQLRDKSLDLFMRYMLRTYEGLFTEFAIIHELKIARELQIEKDKLIKYMQRLHEQDVIEYHPASSDPMIAFLRPIARPDRFQIDEKLYFFLKGRSLDRVEAMIAFAEAEKCREIVMLNYFGQVSEENCGHCDVCLGSHKRIPTEEEKTLIVQRLKNYLSTERSWSIPDLLDMFPLVFRNRVLYCLNKLEDVEWLSIDENQKVYRNER